MIHNGFHKYCNFINPIIFSLIVSALLCLLAGQNSLKAQEKYSTIIGRVFNPRTYDPVVGATIIALSTTKGASTNVYGKFVIPKIPYGIYKLKATAVGFVPDETCVVVDRDTVYVNFELPQNYIHVFADFWLSKENSIINGKVVETNTHSPIRDATIFLDSIAKHVSGNNGKFFIEDVTPGKHKLQVRSLGYDPKEINIFVDLDTTNVDIELSHKNTICDNPSSMSPKLSTISGTVLDTNSNPVSGANILVVSTIKGATADQKGHYTIPPIPQGQYKLKVTAIGYVSVETTLVVKNDSMVVNFIVSEDNRSIIDYEYSEGKSKIVGKVTDIKSKPVYGVTIIDVSSRYGASSDSNGNFLIPYLYHEKYKLRTTTIGYDPIDTGVIVNGDSVIVNLQLTRSLPPEPDSALKQYSTISGRVTGITNGKPISGAKIIIMGTNIGSTTDTNGYFEIKGVNHAGYSLVCKCANFQIETTSLVVHQANAVTNFTLSPDIGHRPMPTFRDDLPARTTFTSDTTVGCVMIIVPFQFENKEYDYSKQYGFIFKTNEWNQEFLDYYNFKARTYLEQRNGKGFLITLNELLRKLKDNK